MRESFVKVAVHLKRDENISRCYTAGACPSSFSVTSHLASLLSMAILFPATGKRDATRCDATKRDETRRESVPRKLRESHLPTFASSSLSSLSSSSIIARSPGGRNLSSGCLRSVSERFLFSMRDRERERE